MDHLRRWWLLASLAAILMAVIVSLHGSPLETEVSPQGIVSLQLTFGKDRAHKILDHWQNTRHNGVSLTRTAIANTWIDALFLLSFTWLFGLTALRLRQYESESWVLSFHHRRMGHTWWMPGALDALENALIMGWLHGYAPGQFGAWTVSVIATVKFLLAAYWLLWVLVLIYLEFRSFWNRT